MFHFSKASKQELEGVHPGLVDLAHGVIERTEVDFAVHDGLRTIEEQEEYVRTGVSQTMDSRHLPQEDGYSHALDLVPYVNGRLRWEWPPIYTLFGTVREVAQELDLPLRWGAVWDRTLNELPPTLEEEVEAYAKRRRSRGLRVFLDGPHVELDL